MINGKLSNSKNDVLGVFVDGECRGLAQATEHPFNDNEYVFLLMAYSNSVDVEDISITYYDAQNDKIYNVSIYAERGSQTELNLADGTSVRINAESSIKYRRNFNAKSRIVNLIGEGYTDFDFAALIEMQAKNSGYDIKSDEFDHNSFDNNNIAYRRRE